MRYHFLYVGTDLCSISSQRGTSQHCDCITQCACLLLQLSLGTHCTYQWRDNPCCVDLGAWFWAEAVHRS